MRRVLIIFTVILLPLFPLAGSASPLEESVPISLTAPCVLLLEADTGAVIFERCADEKRPVASVTKLMTLLILFEKLDAGDITIKDQVTVSKYAASMTGSGALLDAGQAYELSELLKATAVASGNDSAVALAEYIAGTESAFAEMMNARAAELQLSNTHYVNCTGLPADGQYTTARDVAALSRELCGHPHIFDYSSIWLSTLTHPGGRVTDLTNTNRLVRFYTDCDGLKTGSTNEAKYCVSATAKRDGMRLIAVVLGAGSSQTRFDEARAMLDYGFATYQRAQVASKGDLTGKRLTVTRGAREDVGVALGAGLTMLLKAGQKSKLTVEVQLPESVSAPVALGQTLGTVSILLEGRVVARLPAVAAEEVRLPGFLEGFIRIRDGWR